jgi:ribose transport system ATP-binding protein
LGGGSVAPTWGTASVSDLRKRFGPTVALDGASFTIKRGEVHGLVGQNGAGKSTLVKILSGLLRPDAGTLHVDGRLVEMHRREHVRVLGVATAFQELTLVPGLSLGQNLVLGMERHYRATTFAKASAAAREAFRRWEAEDLDPDALTSTVPLALRQRVEVVKALDRCDGLLILDEPTSALTPEGVEWLKRQVGRIRERGASVAIITHRLVEIEDVCDTVTVLRDGVAVGTMDSRETNTDHIISLMLGGRLAAKVDRAPRAVAGDVALKAEALVVPPGLRDASFELHRGEILGVAGLEGHGQRELFLSLFGVARPSSGGIVVGGRQVRLRSPRDAIRDGIGICLVPEDRKSEGLLQNRSVRENLSLANLSRVSSFGFFLRRRAEVSTGVPVMRALNLSPSTFERAGSALSGGNQQKVVVGKWLARGSNLLLMYDPLRGVDVGAKAEFFEWMQQFTASGGSILFYSSDIDELLAACGRVLVFYRGRLARAFDQTALDHNSLLSAMLGES